MIIIDINLYEANKISKHKSELRKKKDFYFQHQTLLFLFARSFFKPLFIQRRKKNFRAFY